MRVPGIGEQAAILLEAVGRFAALSNQGGSPGQAGVTDGQLEELLLLAIEGRQQVRNQLHLMAPGEYAPVTIRARLLPSGSVVTLDSVPRTGTG